MFSGCSDFNISGGSFNHVGRDQYNNNNNTTNHIRGSQNNYETVNHGNGNVTNNGVQLVPEPKRRGPKRQPWGPNPAEPYPREPEYYPQASRNYSAPPRRPRPPHVMSDPAGYDDYLEPQEEPGYYPNYGQMHDDSGYGGYVPPPPRSRYGRGPGDGYGRPSPRPQQQPGYPPYDDYAGYRPGSAPAQSWNPPPNQNSYTPPPHAYHPNNAQRRPDFAQNQGPGDYAYDHEQSSNQRSRVPNAAYDGYASRQQPGQAWNPGPGQQSYPPPPSSSRGSEREYRQDPQVQQPPRTSRNPFATRSPPEQQREQEKDDDDDMNMEDEHESGSGSGGNGSRGAGGSVKFSRNDAR
ncbi:hypothetical protein Moror_5588 [Moniliophthora roreri MCA 2997]|uniref:Uncharacterized protein n=2 Tax=Moniliophthora roreri TaxID=221103 RepID=V2WMT2_MONRO|nr:hypothetical protein Moror_5588 [Moniliophthora roreri MCA 2997]KAI3603771.1 hypothetical protein WG66_006707 [Moniliophthora roreri]